MIRSLVAAIVALGLCACTPTGGIKIEDAVISAPGGAVAAGYFTLTNGGAGDKLIAVASPAAKSVEMHSSEMKDGMMSMRRLETVDVPAGAKVAFAPGGMHLMIFGAQAGLTDGQSVPVTLTFEKAGAKEFAFTVKSGVVEAMH